MFSIGLGDVLTGLGNGDGKSGQHSQLVERLSHFGEVWNESSVVQ